MEIRKNFKQSMLSEGHQKPQIDKAWKRATVISRVEGFPEMRVAIESVTQDILKGKY